MGYRTFHFVLPSKFSEPNVGARNEERVRKSTPEYRRTLFGKLKRFVSFEYQDEKTVRTIPWGVVKVL